MSMAAAPPPTESSECRPQPVQVATTPGSWSRFTSAFSPHSAHAQASVSKSSARSPAWCNDLLTQRGRAAGRRRRGRRRGRGPCRAARRWRRRHPFRATDGRARDRPHSLDAFPGGCAQVVTHSGSESLAGSRPRMSRRTCREGCHHASCTCPRGNCRRVQQSCRMWLAAAAAARNRCAKGSRPAAPVAAAAGAAARRLGRRPRRRGRTTSRVHIPCAQAVTQSGSVPLARTNNRF